MTLPPAVRPSLAVAGSIATFALLIEHAGLVPAVTATVIVASLGENERRIRRTLTLSVCLAAAAWLLFVGLLDQPFTAVRGF